MSPKVKLELIVEGAIGDLSGFESNLFCGHRTLKNVQENQFSLNANF